jgi:mycothiol synthase
MPTRVTEDASAGPAAVLALGDAAHEIDGYDAFDEQTRLDLEAGRRAGHVFVDASGDPVAATVTGRGQLDLVVSPAHRGAGVGDGVLAELLTHRPSESGSGVTAWSHGDHPAARVLAARHGFEAVRTLLALRLDLDASRAATHDALGAAGSDGVPADTGGTASAALAGRGIHVSSFDPAADAPALLELNARAFAQHPEQGGMTAGDLAERAAEPWFDPDNLLVARDDAGRMLGFHWLKLEPGEPEGEVYVLGVDPDAAGRGLGRALLQMGLDRLRARGRTAATLYVEGDNVPALRLYRHAGFVDDAVHVQYRRR